MKQDTLLTKIIIGVLLVTVLAYVGFSILKKATNPYQFVGVYTDVVEETVSLNTWAFRQEQRLESAMGLLSFRLDEGEKARAGQLAVISYSDQQALMQQQKIRTLTTQESQLNYAISDDALDGTNLETGIAETGAALRSSAATGDFTHLVDDADTYKKLMLRRVYLQSEPEAAEMGGALVAMRGQLSTLQTSTAAGAQSLYTPAAGIFSTYVDGYEQIYNPALLTTDLGPTQLQAILKTPPQSNDGFVAKVVTSSVWNLVMVVPENQLDLFRRQSKVSVRTASLPEALPMSVERVGFVENGQAVVVLSSRDHLNKALALREQTASIVFRSEEGIRVPKEALRSQKDEETEEYHTGVFTITGYRAEFKPVTVVAEDSSDYIVRANPADDTDKLILRSGDEVIISSAELYDGKVVR